MTRDDDERRRQIALFRYGLIADLLEVKGPRCGLYARLEEKAARAHCIPGSRRTHVAAETIRGWLGDYRSGGFDALLPTPRKDVGASRSIPRDVQDLLLSVKEEQPELTIPMVIKDARAKGQLPESQELPLSTVHRLLSRHGLMKRRANEPTQKDHRRFEFQYAGELWMSDVMHGPAVLIDGRRKQKTYLIAFIDDATRIVPFARFALSEGNIDFMPTLEQAIRRRGIPQRLFVDNGSAYRSQHLALVMAKLGITLIHARVRHPQAKGKQERWFRRVRTQFLPTLGNETLTLDKLNQRFWAWVETEYHATPHRGLGDGSPEDRWAGVSGKVRYPGPDLHELFLFEAKRKVRKDRTVSLDGIHYEVDALLVDETITLRFDPADRRVVQVWHEGRRAHDARPVDLRANCHVKRSGPVAPMRLAALVDGEEET